MDQRVRRGLSGRSHFVDQFNFVNGTAEFAGTSARIAKSELPDFLDRGVSYLAENTYGYGVWAYKDYRENYVVNGTFESGPFNWNIVGRWKITGSAEQWLEIDLDAQIETEVFFNRYLFKFDKLYGPFQCTFQLSSEGGGLPSEFEICLGDRTAKANINPDELYQRCEISIEYSGNTAMSQMLKMRFHGDRPTTFKIRDIQLFNHVLTNGLYRLDGAATEAMNVLREKNRRLRDVV